MTKSGAVAVALSLLIALVVPGEPVNAELCAIDNVPAATLLLPYFQIDLRKPREKVRDTVVSIGNADAAPAIAHVTIWTDMSIPTWTFDIYLTGYDLQSFSLADLFFSGDIPETLPQVGFGEDDPECGVLGGDLDLEELQDAHTGREVKDGLCWGRKKAGRKARGYITIDVTNECSLVFPNDPGYFPDSSGFQPGIASTNNQLWGQYFIVSKGQVQAENLVHIEAQDSAFGPGSYTFYGRYVGFSGEDQREPLATAWAVRHIDRPEDDSPLLDDTFLQVWRDSRTSSPQPFECGEEEDSGFYPLSQSQIVAFDEEENAVELFFDDEEEVEIPAFPAETQMERVGKRGFPTPFKNGWAYLNLNHGPIAQSFVSVRQDAKQRRSVHAATPLSHACDANGLPFFFEASD